MGLCLHQLACLMAGLRKGVSNLILNCGLYIVSMLSLCPEVSVASINVIKNSVFFKDLPVPMYNSSKSQKNVSSCLPSL